MANRGGPGFDLGFTPGTRALTTTAQFMWVYGDQTAGTSYTPNVPNTTTALLYPVGVVQSGNLSAGSNQMTVRVAGVTAVNCADTCLAFAWLRGNTTGSVMQATLTSGATATITTAAITNIALLGQALETGVTGSVIEMLIRPYVSAYGIQ